jgi:hypothetical protein
VSNIPLGGGGALRRDTEQGSEFADRQRAGAHFRSHPYQCGVPGSPHSVVDYFEASHEHAANMGSARKCAAHPHRLCSTLLNVGEANKHIPEDGSVGRRCRSRCDPAAGVDACQKANPDMASRLATSPWIPADIHDISRSLLGCPLGVGAEVEWRVNQRLGKRSPKRRRRKGGPSRSDVASRPVGSSRSSGSVARPSHSAASHPPATVPPRFVAKFVHNNTPAAVAHT